MQTFDEIDIQEIPLSSPIFRKRVEDFLAANGLRFEEVDSYYAVLDRDGGIIAGAGLCKDVMKCIAVDSGARSGGLLGPLVSHVISIASTNGVSNLKVFTKPGNESIFRSLGFHLIASAPKAILMENGRGLEDYLRTLAGSAAHAELPSDSGLEVSSLPESTSLHPLGGLRGVIVMNANPFTLGHRYLVRKASEAVDHLFVLPVREDNGIFPYEERLEMIKSGCGPMATVLEGSAYQISDITFPTYFLKDLSEASETQIRLDLDLFGRHIAPALGAEVRFVGSEPSDPLTARYNELMKDILPAYGIRVVEIPRLNVENDRPGIAVSASTVRKALDGGSFKTAASLTPPSTWPYLVAELSARALRMELDASLKPGLVDPTSNGAHSDMDYDLMLGSIKVIRRSFAKHLVEVLSSCAPESVGNQKDDIIINRSRIQADEVLSNWGKAIEKDVLEYTEGINTHRGAIFSLGITSAAALALCGEMQLSDNKQDTSSMGHENATHESSNILIFNNLHFTTQDLSEEISRLAEGLEQGPSSHGGRIVNEYGVKGALQMAREGYRPLFEDWLPFYRGLASTDMWRLQKTLLRIMSRLDDTCVIHRVGFDRAQEVRKEAQALLEDFSPEELKQMKERYDSEGISPGGAADMLALTILADSLLN